MKFENFEAQLHLKREEDRVSWNFIAFHGES